MRKDDFSKVVLKKKESVSSINEVFESAMQVFDSVIDRIKGAMTEADKQISEVEAQQLELSGVMADLKRAKASNMGFLNKLEEIVGSVG